MWLTSFDVWTIQTPASFFSTFSAEKDLKKRCSIMSSMHFPLMCENSFYLRSYMNMFGTQR